MKKAPLACALFALTIGGYFTVTQYLHSKPSANDVTQTSKIEMTIPVPPKFGAVPPPIQGPDGPITATAHHPDEIPQAALDEVNSPEFQRKNMIDNQGFSEDGARAFQERRSVPIADGPESLKEVLTTELESLKRDGYAKVDEDSANAVINFEQNLTGSASDPIKHISFEPSKIPENLASKLKYAGYGFDSSSYNPKDGGDATALQRLYTDSKSSLIIYEEPLAKDARSILTQEFVNTRVGGYDASYEVKKSPSGQTYTSLVWSNENHVYIFYQYGEPIQQTQLVDLANSFQTLNK